MKVMVTGSAGFIGSHVAEAVEEAGHEVVPFDLRAGADVRDEAALDRSLPGVDLVVHQAAKVGLGVDVSDLPAYAAVNVYGTAVLLAAMARHGVGRLVLASSMVVYGEGAYDCAGHGRVRPGPRAREDLDHGLFDPVCPLCGARVRHAVIGEDAPPDPRNAYATTKLAQEHLAANWARETGGTAVALRYHNVYGPRMPRDTPYAGVAAIFRSALAAGRAPRVFEDGGQVRDFVHVRDVARANLAAAGATPPPGRLTIYNIASGTPHTVGEMAAALAAARGGPEPVVTGEYRLGDVRHIVAAPGRARAELGFQAAVGFEAGMTEFAAAPLGAT
ncbi:dTDP-L-rhamnose 4-epimerase [Nonomuraea muscovyensis]|uniref:UDP-glucose 4-epimerase n=1 Tax=Nonomuraea muscovyensis TaxID=1124761 RepID=A0A7X0C1P4_9ACTN|nr:NAD-dependent epimerase/dehydratase family protein [Nonomuraea muscovyensis]MBB6345461.1 dTDP-L-rhamnose 4-epimerase [Nonomuraea muscovyensis]